MLSPETLVFLMYAFWIKAFGDPTGVFDNKLSGLKSPDYMHVLYFRKRHGTRVSEMMFRRYIGNISVEVTDILAGKDDVTSAYIGLVRMSHAVRLSQPNQKGIMSHLRL